MKWKALHFWLHFYHSVPVSQGGLLCGGFQDSCLQWSPNMSTWEQALTLDVKRRGHVSWTTRGEKPGQADTYLMGGFIPKGGGGRRWRTTTLIKNDGSWSQEPGFPLKFDAM